jgi:hypothetical protein
VFGLSTISTRISAEKREVQWLFSPPSFVLGSIVESESQLS